MANELYIYNLTEYIKNDVSTSGYNYTCNGEQVESDNDLIDISESAGMEKGDFDRKDFLFTIISYSQSKLTSRKQIQDVHNLINKKFGLTLPAATINSILYPAVKTWKIIALSLPGFIGNDSRGRVMFSSNYSLTTE